MAAKATRSLQELSAEVATTPDSTAFVELAAAYRERGDFKRAIRLCLRGLQRHPTHVEAHFELGRIYEAQGEPELALDEWNIVRQLAPDHLPARWALARLLIEEGQVADAENELRDLALIAPDDRKLVEAEEQLRERREAAAEREAARLFSDPDLDLEGTFGILLLDAAGAVLAGGMREEAPAVEGDLSRNLSGARAEAERVASHLELGSWKAMVVESRRVRLAVSPVRDGVIIVATAPDMPAGRAARGVERARQIAERYLRSRDR